MRGRVFGPFEPGAARQRLVAEKILSGTHGYTFAARKHPYSAYFVNRNWYIVLRKFPRLPHATILPCPENPPALTTPATPACRKTIASDAARTIPKVCA